MSITAYMPTMNTSAAWWKHAPTLALWAQRYLVNRTDAFGKYPPLNRRDRIKSYTAKEEVFGPLNIPKLLAHFRGHRVEDVIGLHAISAENTCRWIKLDIDQHGGGNEQEVAEKNLRIALELDQRSVDLGFRPILSDSNGKGGYHFEIIFSSPIPAKNAYHFGKWLARDFDIESFPKQEEVNEIRPYGNWIRLHGRHHTRDHWERVWNGDHWLVGTEAVSEILWHHGDDPRLIPSEAAPPPPQTSKPAAASQCSVIVGEDVIIQAKRYISVISGVKGGRGEGREKLTFHVACILVIGFNLSVEQSLPLLREWNTKCEPNNLPQAEIDKRLLHKLEDANLVDDSRGNLIQEQVNLTGIYKEMNEKLPTITRLVRFDSRRATT